MSEYHRIRRRIRRGRRMARFMGLLFAVTGGALSVVGIGLLTDPAATITCNGVLTTSPGCKNVVHGRRAVLLRRRPHVPVRATSLRRSRSCVARKLAIAMEALQMTERTGRCLCGAVTFTLAADPVAARVCWCHDCQHLAANGTVNLIVPADALRISGTLSEHTKTAASGNEVTRQFCPTCGAHLFAKSSGAPQFRVIRAGNLDDPSSIQPTRNIWASSAPRWACLDPALERVEHQPAPPKPAAGTAQR